MNCFSVLLNGSMDFLFGKEYGGCVHAWRGLCVRYTLHSGVTEMWGAHKVCFGIARLHVNKYVPCKNSASVFLGLIEQAC